MKDITPVLQSLGLQDSEIKTYLKGLRAGPSTAAELSKLTKYSRQAVYTAIESLSERGLMANVMRGKKRLYVAEPPSKLLAYAKRRDQEMHERVKDLERVVPELELQTGGERPVVRMFEGKEGIRALIEDMKVSRPKELVELSDMKAMYATLDLDDLAPLRKELKRANAKVMGIYAGTPIGDQTVQADRIHLADSDTGFNSNISVYGNTLSMATFEGKMHSIIIESRPLSDAFRLLFRLAFGKVKKK